MPKKVQWKGAFFISWRNASDEEIVALRLSLSYLRDHHVSMIVAKQWAKEANDFLYARPTVHSERNRGLDDKIC
jgi:hypothetical protein